MRGAVGTQYYTIFMVGVLPHGVASMSPPDELETLEDCFITFLPKNGSRWSSLDLMAPFRIKPLSTWG